jgi:hypothetical protein
MNPEMTEQRPPDLDGDRIAERVARCATAGGPAVEGRLAELDREWEAGRVLAAGAGAAVLVGTALGAAVDRRLLAVPAVAGGLLLLAAVSGWGPGLRRLSRYRTGVEIGEERAALKSLRGDFRHLTRLTPAADRAAVSQWEGEGGSTSQAGADDAHDEHDLAAAGDALRAARS